MVYMNLVSQLVQLNDANDKLPSSVPMFRCKLVRGAPECLIPVVTEEAYSGESNKQPSTMLSDMDIMLSASLMTQGLNATKLESPQDKHGPVQEYKPPQPSNLDLLLDQHEQELRNQLHQEEEKRKNPKTLYDMINNSVFPLNYESPFTTKNDETTLQPKQDNQPSTDVNPFNYEDLFSNVFTEGASKKPSRTKASNLTKKGSKQSTPEDRTPPQEQRLFENPPQLDR